MGAISDEPPPDAVIKAIAAVMRRAKARIAAEDAAEAEAKAKSRSKRKDGAA